MARLSDEELAARINKICLGPEGLRTLDPQDARLIACAVFANTAIATKWTAEGSLNGAAAALTHTIAMLPQLPASRSAEHYQ